MTEISPQGPVLHWRSRDRDSREAIGTFDDVQDALIEVKTRRAASNYQSEVYVVAFESGQWRLFEYREHNGWHDIDSDEVTVRGGRHLLYLIDHEGRVSTPQGAGGTRSSPQSLVQVDRDLLQREDGAAHLDVDNFSDRGARFGLQPPTPSRSSNAVANRQLSTQLSDLEQVTGQTYDEMARLHLEYLQGQATDAGTSVREYLRGEVATRGSGGKKAVWWPSLSVTEQAGWRRRFDASMVAVRANAPAEVVALLDSVVEAGGSVIFDPVSLEKSSAVAIRQGNSIKVGRQWIEAVEADPDRVMGLIAHEIGGHFEYGDTASWHLTQGTLDLLSSSERRHAKSGANSMYSAFGYMETELYAELRELAYRIPGHTPGDSPATDVPKQLRAIRQAFGPQLGAALAEVFERRIAVDEHVTDEARALFATHRADIFGDRLVDR